MGFQICLGGNCQRDAYHLNCYTNYQKSRTRLDKIGGSQKSVAVCYKSVAVCYKSVAVCYKSVAMCYKSVAVCYKSVAVCYKSVAVLDGGWFFTL